MIIFEMFCFSVKDVVIFFQHDISANNIHIYIYAILCKIFTVRFSARNLLLAIYSNMISQLVGKCVYDFVVQ